ncbi:hypothetical protein [Austwickia chelonae]|uniref:hypothetical protein n=1 Tax=Austwickia chelonae TaxID=100225 RepID=UPI0013C31289|nr:hypothetical protein [Austwickia chelonae]
MRADEYHAGSYWAYREGKTLGTPAVKAEALMWVAAKRPSRKSPQMTVYCREGELAGIEDFVLPGWLVCHWKDWLALLRWEQGRDRPAGQPGRLRPGQGTDRGSQRRVRGFRRGHLPRGPLRIQLEHRGGCAGACGQARRMAARARSLAPEAQQGKTFDPPPDSCNS